MSEWIYLIVEIYLMQATEKASGQIAVAHSPLLNSPDSAWWCLSDCMFKEVFCQGMCQPMIQTDIGLEMVVNCGTFDSIKNGIDMCLPLVRRFEFPKGNQIWGVRHGRESVEIFIR